MLTAGLSQAMVRRHFNAVLERESGAEEYFNKSNFHTHRAKHLSSKDAAVRNVLEAKAKEVVSDIEAYEDYILTTEGAAAAVVQIGMMNMTRGTAPVSIQDMLQAITIMEKMKMDRGDESAVELEREFKAFLKAVKRVAPESMWKDIVEVWYELLGENPFKAVAELEPITEAEYEEVKDDC